MARSKALRLKADEFNGRLKDTKAKDFLRTMVFHHLADVDGFFLGDPTSRPSMEMWETMWVNSAEMMMGLAEKSFESFEKQVNQYGGPENVKLVG